MIPAYNEELLVVYNNSSHQNFSYIHVNNKNFLNREKLAGYIRMLVVITQPNDIGFTTCMGRSNTYFIAKYVKPKAALSLTAQNLNPRELYILQGFQLQIHIAKKIRGSRCFYNCYLIIWIIITPPPSPPTHT